MKIWRISIRTIFIAITVVALYFASMAMVGDQVDRFVREFSERGTNQMDFGDDRSLKTIDALHVTDATTVFEFLTLRKRFFLSYDASLSHVGSSDCSVLNCRTEFSVDPFGVKEVSHRQDFVSLFMPSNFPLELREPAKY